MLAEGGPHALVARWRNGQGGSRPRAQTSDCAGPCALAGGYTLGSQEGDSWGAVLIRRTRINDDSGWRSQEWRRTVQGRAVIEAPGGGGSGEQAAGGGGLSRGTPQVLEIKTGEWWEEQARVARRGSLLCFRVNSEKLVLFPPERSGGAG